MEELQPAELQSPQRFFHRPPQTSPDAHRIWNESGLGEIVDITSVYWALDAWARRNCEIFIKDERPYVFWTSPSGVYHECFADTFAHWILCACQEIAPKERIPPLTPNSEIFQPIWDDKEEEEVKNEIIFHDFEKIGDEADNIMIQTLKEDVPLRDDVPEEFVNMDLEAFLAEEE